MWPLAKAVRDYLRQQPRVHADETPHWRNTELRWMWVLATAEATYFQTHVSRGQSAATNLLGDAFPNLLVVDRLGSYRVVPAERRQFCIPHVIRNFRKMAQRTGSDGQIGRQIVTSLPLLIRIDHRRQQGLALPAFRRRCRRVRDKLETLLKRGVLMGRKPSRGQCQTLLASVSCLFTFVQYPSLPLTNNEAERALRPYVIWRKTSFSTKLAWGDRFRAYMLTVVETCKRQGISALKVLREICRQGLAGRAITTTPLAQKAVVVGA